MKKVLIMLMMIFGCIISYGISKEKVDKAILITDASVVVEEMNKNSIKMKKLYNDRGALVQGNISKVSESITGRVTIHIDKGTVITLKDSEYNKVLDYDVGDVITIYCKEPEVFLGTLFLYQGEIVK